MGNIKNNLIFLIVSLQIGFFSIWYFMESSKLSNPEAREILVKSLPMDPRDFISGNYFTLSYEFSIASNFLDYIRRKETEEEIYAVLKQEGKYFIPDYIAYEMPKIKKGQVAIKGRINYRRANNGRIEYGIEKYFINENSKEPNSRTDKIEALLIVNKNAVARIKELYINDLPYIK